MRIKYFLYLFTLLFIGYSCKKDTAFNRLDGDGKFTVNFDVPAGEVFAPSKVVLTNRTKNAEKYYWQFDTLRTISGQDTIRAAESRNVIPDTILFDLPGTYEIKLTAWQGGREETVSKQLVVKKAQPRIIPPAVLAILQPAVFTAAVFQFPGTPVTYNWDFGDGGTSTEANPTHIFQGEGNKVITLTINDGQESLTTTLTVFVQGETAKTLYYTDVRSGQLFKYRLTQLRPSTPQGLAVNIGVHPLSVSVYNDRIVMTDAGVGVSFTSIPADGRVFSVDLNGQNSNLITRPAAGASYGDDPFCSTVDDNGNVHWVSRFGGVRTLPITASEAPYPASRLSVTAANAGVSSTFGWLDGNLRIVNGELWYSKHGSAGRGLYRYTIAGAFIQQIPGFQNLKIRAFEVDTKHNKIYFAINFTNGGLTPGFYRSNLDGSGIELLDACTNFSTEGGTNEFTFITDIVIDTDPDDKSSGYVYYPYRDAADLSSAGVVIGDGSRSGVKRIPLTGTPTPSFFVSGVIPYGLAMDNVRR
jgi:PKD repeat protein